MPLDWSYRSRKSRDYFTGGLLLMLSLGSLSVLLPVTGARQRARRGLLSCR